MSTDYWKKFRIPELVVVMKVLAQFTTCTEETDSFLIKTRVQVWISSVYGNNEPVYFNNNIPFPRTINYEIIHYPTQSCLYRYKASGWTTTSGAGLTPLVLCCPQANSPRDTEDWFTCTNYLISRFSIDIQLYLLEQCLQRFYVNEISWVVLCHSSMVFIVPTGCSYFHIIYCRDYINCITLFIYFSKELECFWIKIENSNSLLMITS